MLSRILSFAAAALIAVSFAPASLAQDSGRSPIILGTWTGKANAAYVRTHAQYVDGTANVELELDVYKQQGNLFWIAQKWRREGQTDWNEAYSVGSFFAHENDEFMITEMGPDTAGGATGFFMGEIDDGRMELTYLGTGTGVAFNTVLDRQR